ncbi:MAG: hypothetical protein ACR2KT_08830 [Methylocella sp.]
MEAKRDTKFRKPQSWFKKYAGLDDKDIWTRIKLRNLRENIVAKNDTREPRVLPVAVA